MIQKIAKRLMSSGFYLLLAFSVQGQILSENAQISLLTYEPIDEIHALFGHSAIRIYDPANRMDWAYNYGTFDFDTPNFMLKFIRGKLLYSLGLQDFKRLVQVYPYRQQTVYEQVLNLTPSQKQIIFNALRENYRPENRHYLYDFFYDNCSTRIRDIFEQNLGDSLSFDTEKVTQNKTFRQLLDEFIEQRTWLDFGIDLILGLPADRTANFSDQMFLPRHLFASLQTATITQGNKPVPFVVRTQTIYQAPPAAYESSFFTSPLFATTLLATALVLLVLFGKNSRISRIAQSVFLFVISLAGVVMLFMWIGTDHIATQNNLNLLWAVPTHFLVGIWILRQQFPKWSRWYLSITAAIDLLLLLTFAVFPQQFHLAVLPILVSLFFILGKKSLK